MSEKQVESVESVESTEPVAPTKEEYLKSIASATKGNWKSEIFSYLKAHPEGATDTDIYAATRPGERVTPEQAANNVASQITYLRKQAMQIDKKDGVLKLVT